MGIKVEVDRHGMAAKHCNCAGTDPSSPASPHVVCFLCERHAVRYTCEDCEVPLCGGCTLSDGTCADDDGCYRRFNHIQDLAAIDPGPRCAECNRPIVKHKPGECRF